MSKCAWCGRKVKSTELVHHIRPNNHRFGIYRKAALFVCKECAPFVIDSNGVSSVKDMTLMAWGAILNDKEK